MARAGDDLELFGAIVGSISFWGSGVAFGKLQEILPGRPIKVPGAGQSALNLVLLVIARRLVGRDRRRHPLAAVVRRRGAGRRRRCWGVMLVLPIGGADMPVVISLLNAFTGLSAAATGIALSNPVMIVAGMIVGASGTILTNQMAKAMNRSVPAIIAGGFGGAVAAPAGGAGSTEGPRCAPRAPPMSRSSCPTRAKSWSRRLWDGGRPGPACRPRAGARARGQGGRGQVRDPPGRGPDARVT